MIALHCVILDAWVGGLWVDMGLWGGWIYVGSMWIKTRAINVLSDAMSGNKYRCQQYYTHENVYNTQKNVHYPAATNTTILPAFHIFSKCLQQSKHCPNNQSKHTTPQSNNPRK